MTERVDQEKQLKNEAKRRYRELLAGDPDKAKRLDDSIGRIVIDEDASDPSRKITAEGNQEEKRESALAVNEIVRESGIGQFLPAYKVDRAVEAVKFYRDLRAEMSAAQSTSESVFFDELDEVTPVNELSVEKVWYEGILDDLQDATDKDVPEDQRQAAIQRLSDNGVNLPPISRDPDDTKDRRESQGNKNRVKVATAVDFLAGGKNNRWSSEEAALDYLENELGVDVDRELTFQEESSRTPRPTEPTPVLRPIEPEEEEAVESDRDKFLDKMDLVLMDNRSAEDRGQGGERRQAIKDLQGEVNFDFIFGDDLDEDDREGKKQRKGDVKRAVRAMRTGQVTEDQRDILQAAGINIDQYGISISPRETTSPVEVTGEVAFYREYGCSKSDYDAILSACMYQIFVMGARSEQEVLNSLVIGTGEWITRRKTRILPSELVGKLKEMRFDAWIGISRVMGEWSDIKNVEEITPSTLKPGLFMSRYTEESFGKMNGVLFPKMTGEENTNYSETERVADIGVEVSKAMRVLLNHFGRPDPDKPHKLLNDYWPFVSAELGVRASLYESLGINRYYGEAAFSFLLSNFMLAQRGVGLDPFSALVKPPEKRLANYEVSEERDPYVRMVVQSRGEGNYNARRDRMSVLSEVKKLVPARLIPTGLDNGGEVALSSEQGWIEWRNRSYVSGADRKRRVLDGERGVNPASDIDSRLTILRSAIDIINSQKAVFTPDAGVDKLAALKTRLFIHLVGNMDAMGYSLESIDFADRRSSSNLAWISRNLAGAAKGYLFTHSIADTENRNGKPWKMIDYVQRANELFQFQVQSGKPKFVGFGEEMNMEHMRDLAGYATDLFYDCEKVINPFRGLGIFTSIASRNAGVPRWYGRSEDVSPAFRAFLSQQQGYLGSWEKLERKLERI